MTVKDSRAKRKAPPVIKGNIMSYSKEPLNKTSSPMGNDRSPESQHNVDHNLRCSKEDSSELETVTRN